MEYGDTQVGTAGVTSSPSGDGPTVAAEYPRGSDVSPTHEAATYPQPTMHPDIRPLRGTENLFRVRQGQYRALCDLRPPTLRVLLVHERDGVYACIEQAQSRR